MRDPLDAIQWGWFCFLELILVCRPLAVNMLAQMALRAMRCAIDSITELFENDHHRGNRACDNSVIRTIWITPWGGLAPISPMNEPETK
jgi:hypothetical protein